MRSIAPVLVLMGIAYTLKSSVSHLRKMAGKTMRVHPVQIFSGIFVLQVLLCLSFLEFSSMNSLEFAFIPAVIMAFGIFTPGSSRDTEGQPVRRNLLYILAVAFVLLFLISDTIFILYHLDHLHLMAFSSWTMTRGIFTCVSLVISILLAVISYQRSGGRLDALLFTLLCLGLAILALRDIICAGLSAGVARQIIFINDMFLVNMIGIAGHLTYVVTEKAFSRKVLLFYVLGLVLTGLVFAESILGKVIIPSVPVLEKGMVHVLFIVVFLAVLVHCAVLVAGQAALAIDISRKRQLLSYLAGMVLIILIGAASAASSAGLPGYPLHNLAFIAFVFIGYAIFYHDIARTNNYTRIRLFVSIWRTLLVLIYLACACGIFYLLRDYPLEYVMFRIIPYGIPPMLSFIGAAFLSLFVLGLEQNRTETLLFSLMCFCYTLLNLDITLVGILTDIELALFISRLDHLFLVLIMLGVNLHLIYSVTRQKKRWWIVYGGYAIGAAIAPFTFTQYYIQGMYSYYWGFFAKKAIAYDVISTLWLVGLIYGMYLLYKAFIHKDASHRTTERNVLWGFALIAALSLTNTPAIYGHEIYPFGTFIFIGLFFFAYGLFKFNLKTALQYVRQIVFWIGLITMLFMVGIAPGILFSPENHIASLFAGILAAAVLYRPIRDGWDSILSLFIRRTADVLNERYHALSDDLSRVRHLEKIHEMIGSWFFKVM
ncbi:MAG TPA: hypothetical protein PLM29_13515, partial [Deltaproteobacteria bacterium]|nr:hypothetical protein [Deltaproteobacteria bacterium]